jgi:cell division protein FtsI/penicillin-binding protein 2
VKKGSLGWTATVSGALMTCLLAGCSGGGRSASATAHAFADAWNRNDIASMTGLMDHPGANFGGDLTALVSHLHATSVVHSVGLVVTKGATATAPLTSTYQLPGIGPWTVSSTLDLARRSGKWEVEWSPAAVAPGMTAGSSLAFVTKWAPRAAITGAGGAALTTTAEQVVVGVEGSRVKNAAQLTAILESAGASAAQVTAALRAATSHPSFFETVFTMSAAQFSALGGNSSPIYQVAGTVFQHVTARTAATPGLAAHLVGSVGPITAQELTTLGAGYDSSSQVGQNGLEAYYEKQLAGTPGGQVQLVGARGVTQTLATFSPKPGTDVATSIDPAVQSAAEQAMKSVTGVAGFVAVRVSTGQLLASVSLPRGSAFDYALDGEFPPGSTFKVLTATALIDKGLSPASPASCPPTVSADGEVFHNAEGETPVTDLSQAFAESCNTAFVQLAMTHLAPTDFSDVAALYGIGRPMKMGLPAFSGSVPTPTDGASLAATSIGQAKVVVSPLDLALAAADVGRGSFLPSRLVVGAPDDSAVAVPFPTKALDGLRSMMAAVVATGTATGTGLPPGTYAKTGTAQYGSGNPIPTDAWLIGYHGEIAFALVEQNSQGNGGPVDGPVIARFLQALPAADR